jgi:cell division protein YceG involved in septum cleavage
MRVDKYTLRRFVVLMPLVIVLLWAGWWGVSKSIEPPTYSCAVSTVNVERGDTIDGIARRNCTGEVLAVISILVDMYGTDIDTWQTIHLPIASPRNP